MRRKLVQEPSVEYWTAPQAPQGGARCCTFPAPEALTRQHSRGAVSRCASAQLGQSRLNLGARSSDKSYMFETLELNRTEADLDRDALLVREAGRLFVLGQASAARLVLADVSPERVTRPTPPRVSPSPPFIPQERRAGTVIGDRARRVFRRDHWTCCYCGRLLIEAHVLALIGQLAGDALPWRSHAMPPAGTHPAIERLYPNVEHVLPLARGGQNDENNLRACCTPCNEWKGDRTLQEAGVELVPAGEGWDGLEPMLRPLQDRWDRRD
jgi:5-methylcytosine-specific restriction endonuclease McrA